MFIATDSLYDEAPLGATWKRSIDHAAPGGANLFVSKIYNHIAPNGAHDFRTRFQREHRFNALNLLTRLRLPNKIVRFTS
jgi:hypothetical protein